jgi:hypothetical protein
MVVDLGGRRGCRPRHGEREGITVLQAPRDEPWGVRELLIQHPDGHTFRIGQSSQGGH